MKISAMPISTVVPRGGQWAISPPNECDKWAEWVAGGGGGGGVEGAVQGGLRN